MRKRKGRKTFSEGRGKFFEEIENEKFRNLMEK